MKQFSEELIQTHNKNNYGGLITSRSTARSHLDASLSEDDLPLAPRYTRAQNGEVIYITASLADGTDISGFYIIADFETKPNSRHMTWLFDSVHDDHILVRDIYEMYCIPRTDLTNFTVDAIETLTTNNKHPLKQEDGMPKTFDFTKHNIGTDWLLQTFEMQQDVPEEFTPK